MEEGRYREWAGVPRGDSPPAWTRPSAGARAANHFLRYTTQDVELPGGTIPAGDAVALWLSSANRDEEVFDDPYTFDIRRQPNKHLGFGVGSHYCVGYTMAKLCLRILFEEIIDAVEDFEPGRPGRTPALEPGRGLRPHPRRRPAPTRLERRRPPEGVDRFLTPTRGCRSGARGRMPAFAFSASPTRGAAPRSIATGATRLAPDVELCAVQLPGRETRFKEPAATSMSGLVDQVVEGIGPLLDQPFALFGHSFGALVSFELCNQLQSLGCRSRAPLRVRPAGPPPDVSPGADSPARERSLLRRDAAPQRHARTRPFQPGSALAGHRHPPSGLHRLRDVPVPGRAPAPGVSRHRTRRHRGPGDHRRRCRSLGARHRRPASRLG